MCVGGLVWVSGSRRVDLGVVRGGERKYIEVMQYDYVDTCFK